MRHGTHRSSELQQLDIRCRGRKVIVANNGANRLTTELTILRGVNMLVESALTQFRGKLEVLKQLLLGRMEQVKLDVLTKVGAVHQQLEPTPGRFELLKSMIMLNLIDLAADHGIELNKHAVNHRLLDLRRPLDVLQQFSNNSRHPLSGKIVALFARFLPG